MYQNNIPTYARFQWINHPRVIHILSNFLTSSKRGRKGYDKVLMLRWLMYRQVMRCSYRDLESMTGIDHSTFVKFRQRLLCTDWFASVFDSLTTIIAPYLSSVTAVIDSSFVETYSTHDEQGSEYNGHKEKNGFKLHQIIDWTTRLPLRQIATPGARSDVILGHHLIRGSPESWRVTGFLGDKAYDDWKLVARLKDKWKRIRVGIPVRRTVHEHVRPFSSAVIRNRRAKESDRYLKRSFLNKRTEIERYFSRKKRVFRLGEERTRHLENFRANCDMVAIMEILEWSTTPKIYAYYSPNSYAAKKTTDEQIIASKSPTRYREEERGHHVR